MTESAILPHLDAIARALAAPGAAQAHPRALPLSIAKAYAALGASAPAAALFQQVLATAPFQLEALLGFADAAAETDQEPCALRALEQGLTKHPRQAGLLHRALRAQARTGALNGQGKPLLTRLVTQKALDPAECLATAKALVQAGAGEEAEQLLAAAVSSRPTHAPFWQERIALALRMGAPERVLGLCDEAAPHLPDQAANLRMRRFQALNALGRPEAVVAAQADLPPDAVAKHPGTALQVAAAQGRLGQHHAAAETYAAVLAVRPEVKRAWIGRIDALRDAEETASALEVCEAALSALADPTPILHRKAELLRRVGWTEAAGNVLDALIAAGDNTAHVRLLRARNLADAGQGDAAEAMLRTLLQAEPAHRGARLTLADLVAGRGDLEAAIGVLSPEADPDPALLVREAELIYAAGDFERLAGALAALRPHIGVLSTLALCRVLLAAEKIGDRDLASAIFQDAASRPSLDPTLAKLLLRAALGQGDAAFASMVEAGIARRLTGADAHNFALEAACLRLGAFEAVRRDRRPPRPCRAPTEARALAQALIQAGRPALAVRYLRRAARVWPEAGWLPRLRATALMRAGAPDAALVVLDQARGAAPDRALDQSVLEILCHMGAYARAIAHIEACAARGTPLSESSLMLTAHLCQGDLARSRTALAGVAGQLEQAQRFRVQFRATFMGQLLTELELLENDCCAAAKSPTVDRAEAFVAPAVAALKTWRPEGDAASGGQAIPRQVFQYWNDQTLPPDLLAVSASWQDLPGWAYRRFDRQGAQQWLREALGADHARAFLQARRPADEADFLRLCLLLVEGGVYADVDDLRIGPPDGLLAQAASCLLFLEPFGTVANNLMIAAPAHPLVARAVDMAKAALLRGDNDNVWIKTGPGLVTRAAACHVLADPAGAGRDTVFLPQHAMYPVVQPGRALPYKSAPNYWNAQSESVTAGTVAALGALAE